MGKLTFILGGARSGKSQFATHLAKESGKTVCYVATAAALDTEMQERIAKHRASRPANWITIEAEQDIADQLQPQNTSGIILIDCITLLVSNVMLKHWDNKENLDNEEISQAVDREIAALLGLIQSSQADWIIVSNEVGGGLIPTYPSGRLYRDVLGKVNQQFVQAAQLSYFLVAGIPIPLHQFKHTG